MRIVVGFVVIGSCDRAESKPPRADQRLQRTLELTASGRWRDAPLGEALRNVANAFEVPLWIDRRVDRAAPITFTADEQPLGELLSALAAKERHGTAPVGALLYVGPEASAKALPSLAASWRDEAPTGWGRRSSWQWPRLGEPRNLAVEAATAAGSVIANPEALPHDLWDGAAYPRLTLADRLTLLAIGFDLRPTLVGDRVVLRPIDFEKLATETATPPSASAAPRASRSRTGSTRYTLRVTEQPFRLVLDQIAERLGLEVRTRSVDAERMERRVSFAVEQATLEELLEVLGRAAGLSVRATTKVILVRPGE